MPRRDADKPRGISDAALKGAREGEHKSHQPPAPDAKTVDPDQAEQNSTAARTTENNEAPMGGAPVAFPAPSAQPTRKEPTQQPAKVDIEWTADEDDDTEWRRAGGGEKPKE
jgi:hypothetical protein